MTKLSCQECNGVMLPCPTGWVCPNGHGRIIPYTTYGDGKSPKNAMKRRKGWLDQIEKGVRKMAELDGDRPQEPT